MRHVFVETNWVVSIAGPVHLAILDAVNLLERANAGGLKLYLPSICISESRRPIERLQARGQADRVRQYLAWAKANGTITPAEDETGRRLLDQMESTVKTEFKNLDQTLKNLESNPGLEIFALADQAMNRALSLAYKDLELKPFDLSILASILVRAENLLSGGEQDLAFCTIDSDLQPWNKSGERKSHLADLYDAARVWVFGDFLLQTPAEPENWRE